MSNFDKQYIVILVDLFAAMLWPILETWQMIPGQTSSSFWAFLCFILYEGAANCTDLYLVLPTKALNILMITQVWKASVCQALKLFFFSCICYFIPYSRCLYGNQGVQIILFWSMIYLALKFNFDCFVSFKINFEFQQH